MRALILAPFSSEGLERLRARMEVFYEPWVETRRLWDPRELAARIREQRLAVVISEADFLVDDVFEAETPLRFIGICRNALNHVDVEAATARAILVVNTPGRNAPAVAEHTMGLMLALARRVPESHAYVKGGHWQDPVAPYITLRGTELNGKTLGIVGLGQIGRQVAKLARAFGMRVIATDPYAKPVRGVAIVSLEELLRESDVVSLHAPPSDKGPMLDATCLALMKPTAMLINTAALGLVDTQAFVEALRSKRLAGAALDVFDVAPLPSSSPFLQLDNVVLTPHLAGATDGTIRRYSETMAADILNFVARKRPLHLVNPEALRKRRG